MGLHAAKHRTAGGRGGFKRRKRRERRDAVSQEPKRALTLRAAGQVTFERRALGSRQLPVQIRGEVHFVVAAHSSRPSMPAPAGA